MRTPLFFVFVILYETRLHDDDDESTLETPNDISLYVDGS
jgi:hypothetical protein